MEQYHKSRFYEIRCIANNVAHKYKISQAELRNKISPKATSARINATSTELTFNCLTLMEYENK